MQVNKMLMKIKNILSLILVAAFFISCTKTGSPNHRNFTITEEEITFNMTDLNQDWTSDTVVISTPGARLKNNLSASDMTFIDLPAGLLPKVRVIQSDQFELYFEGRSILKIVENPTQFLIRLNGKDVAITRIYGIDSVIVNLEPYKTKIRRCRHGHFNNSIYITEDPLTFDEVDEIIYVNWLNESMSGYFFYYNSTRFHIGEWKYSPTSVRNLNDIDDVQNYIFYDKDNADDGKIAFGNLWPKNIDPNSYALRRIVGNVWLAQRKHSEFPIFALRIIDQIYADPDDSAAGGTIILEYGVFFIK